MMILTRWNDSFVLKASQTIEYDRNSSHLLFSYVSLSYYEVGFYLGFVLFGGNIN